jgi:hypothetical protein
MLARRDNSVPENARNVGTITLNPTSGNFELRDILPGPYELFGRIQDPRGTPGANGLVPMAWGRASFDVRDQNVEGLTINVHASVDVRGKVSLDGKTPPAGNTIRVGLQPDGPSVLIANYQTVTGRQQSPAADGSFAVPTVPEGLYRVTFNGAMPDSYVADIRQSGMSIYDAGLYVTDKTPEPFEVIVRSDGGIVEGMLSTADAKTAGRTLVALIPAEARRSNSSLYKTTISDLQGHFLLRGVPPGSYKAFAWENLPDGAYLNADFVRMHENEGLAIEVAPGKTTPANVRVIANHGDKN